MATTNALNFIFVSNWGKNVKEFMMDCTCSFACQGNSGLEAAHGFALNAFATVQIRQCNFGRQNVRSQGPYLDEAPPLELHSRIG